MQQGAIERLYPDAVMFTEEASARNLNRPVLSKLLDGLEPDDILVVAKLDRLTRSLFDFAGLMIRSREEGWKLVALDLGVDTTTPAGEMMANVLATFAQYERRLISLRTSEALQARKAGGMQLGRPDRVPADVVRKILKMRDDGELSYRQIAEQLNADHVPTAQGGQRWHASTISGVLKRARGPETS